MSEVEEIKHLKDGLDVLHDIDRFAVVGEQWIPKEDMVRLKWYGLYHDRPKMGTFMLRLKIPSGIMTAEQLRTVGRISTKYGKNYGEITTRQNIQLHWLLIREIPEIFASLREVGITTSGACGDIMRNVVGCPVAGISKDEIFDASPIVREITQYFLGNKEFSNLPRKYKVSVDGCNFHCALPEINCTGFTAVRRTVNGEETIGFTVRVGGGLSSSPHISKPLGVILRTDQILPVLKVMTEIWRDDPKYRKSRSRARFKFIIDDYGVEKFRAEVEKRLDEKLEGYPDAQVLTNIGVDHMGVFEQKQHGYCYIGVPVLIGRITGEQMIAVADTSEKFGNGDIRLTNMQNFIIANVPKENLKQAREALVKIGLPADGTGLKARFIACTGLPFCNFAVAETKLSTAELVTRLDKRFGEQIAGLRINVTGCPNSCAQQWIADIGLQGTGAKTETGMVEAFDIAVGGGLGKFASLAKVVKRRVITEEAVDAIERLITSYLDNRYDGELFKQFCDRHSVQQLAALIEGSPASASPSPVIEATSTQV